MLISDFDLSKEHLVFLELSKVTPNLLIKAFSASGYHKLLAQRHCQPNMCLFNYGSGTIVRLSLSVFSSHEPETITCR